MGALLEMRGHVGPGMRSERRRDRKRADSVACLGPLLKHLVLRRCSTLGGSSSDYTLPSRGLVKARRRLGFHCDQGF
jgi:hypothetical protein